MKIIRNRQLNIQPLRLAGLMALIVLLLAACQPMLSTSTSNNNQVPVTAPTTAPTVAPTGTTAAMADVTVNVATDPKLGKFLVDDKGLTLYMFKKDTADTSNCTGNCLKAWPPLLTQGHPKAGAGVDQSMLGTAKLADGSMIVTYNHMPLYHFAKDMKAGDVVGQGVNNVWFVVAPNGQPVTTMPSSSSSNSSASSSSSSSSSNSSSSMSSSSSNASALMLNVANDPKLGKILVDGKGMTLYAFMKDTPDKSNCTAGCLKAWPPFLSTSNVTAGTGLDQSLIGSTSLADGSKIVTYNHMPLYFWAGDTKPGDTLGQGVNGVWFVVDPTGKPVKTTP